MLGCGVLLSAMMACTADEETPTTLRVLASSELADMEPLLDELRRDIGIELVMDYGGTVQASNELEPGKYRHDLAWLSSDRYLRLKWNESGYQGERPLSTNIMLSPVVIGLKHDTAELLRRTARTTRLSWADIADGAASGRVRFGMADPKTANSGLVTLVGVATAAADTGGALRPEDVTCDRLRGFFSGQVLTADTSSHLIERFVELQHRVDGLITYESALLSLNASGRLREPLEIIYPRDGIVMSEYPILLLDPAKRGAYDKVVEWLKSESTQKKIMDRTLRRPLDTRVPRDPRLREPVGNALYFPDQKKVLDQLLNNYGDSTTQDPHHIFFVLDFSGSMRGKRISALKSTFAGLGGTDDSTVGKFVRFYKGEKVTVIRFGGRILGEKSFTVGGRRSMESLRDFIDTGDFDENTAIWSALDHAYQKAEGLVRENPQRRVSIVLMTDGQNNAGMSLDEFLRRHASAGRSVHTYTVRFGEAAPGELNRAAQATGGHMVDATTKSLLSAFKEIRGCL